MSSHEVCPRVRGCPPMQKSVLKKAEWCAQTQNILERFVPQGVLTFQTTPFDCGVAIISVCRVSSQCRVSSDAEGVLIQPDDPVRLQSVLPMQRALSPSLDPA